MRIVLTFINRRKIIMAINSSPPKVRIPLKTNTKLENDLKPKYVVFRRGKTICLAEKGLESTAFNVNAVRKIAAGDPVSILSNGMSRVQIARVSKALNDSGAKITIINK